MSGKPPGGFWVGLLSAVLAAWPVTLGVTRSQAPGHPVALPGLPAHRSASGAPT
jgi:hypothetical protein